MVKKNIFQSGQPGPLGCSIRDGRANFAVFSQHASKVFLGIFKEGKETLLAEQEMERTGDIWHLAIEPVPSGATYAYRAEGPQTGPHRFDSSKWLADPYARSIDSSFRWDEHLRREAPPAVRAHIRSEEPFDWEGVQPPRKAPDEWIIYEMHVRSFTIHSSSRAKHPGTFLGIIEKIPHLQALGVTAVELMPIFEFDETHLKNIDPQTKQPLPNVWGYSPLHYFVPMRRYAVQDPIREFKTLVRELHRHGIAILLDVVYNHTGEGSEKNYAVSFRGLDQSVYYIVDSQGRDKDYTGCGNTFNGNHPIVQQLILDSLQYWADEMQVDGFRFDLAACMNRGIDGSPMQHPPLLEAIQKDPILSQKKLIAEAWDAAGQYLIGQFYQWGPWNEWDGSYRDQVRRFMKGTDGCVSGFATAFCGNEARYGAYKTPLASINFVTAHDGYSLHDLVTYQQKHNLRNGEENRDGNNQNDSWNCGFEGETNDPEINQLRQRQMRNFLLAMFLSQGTPMLLMGDEYGHTRRGNNNPYVQDNELNWFLWDLLKPDSFSFVSGLIEFRKRHREFHNARFLTDKDISWHGVHPRHPDWSFTSRFIACELQNLFIAFNSHYKQTVIDLPPGPWTLVVDTTNDWKEHSLFEPEKGKPAPQKYPLIHHAAILLYRFQPKGTLENRIESH